MKIVRLPLVKHIIETMIIRRKFGELVLVHLKCIVNTVNNELTVFFPVY